MKLIVLVRHAKAETAVPGVPDHSRALTDQGRKDAQTLGQSLTALGFEPEVALVSDAARTVETWVIVSRGWDVPEIVRGRELYNIDAGSLLEILRELPLTVERVIVVGHNPTMSYAAEYLAGDNSNQAAAERVEIGLRTGTAALIEYNGDWEDLGHETARLRAVVGRGDRVGRGD